MFGRVSSLSVLAFWAMIAAAAGQTAPPGSAPVAAPARSPAEVPAFYAPEPELAAYIRAALPRIRACSRAWRRIARRSVGHARRRRCPIPCSAWASDSAAADARGSPARGRHRQPVLPLVRQARPAEPGRGGGRAGGGTPVRRKPARRDRAGQADVLQPGLRRCGHRHRARGAGAARPLRGTRPGALRLRARDSSRPSSRSRRRSRR